MNLTDVLIVLQELGFGIGIGSGLFALLSFAFKYINQNNLINNIVINLATWFSLMGFGVLVAVRLFFG